MTLFFSPEEITAHQNDFLVDYKHTPPGEQLMFAASSFAVQSGSEIGFAHGVFWFRNSAGKVRLPTMRPGSNVVHRYIRCGCEFRARAITEFETARGALLNLDSIEVPALAGNDSEEECRVTIPKTQPTPPASAPR